jgi:hypothetical protein
LVKRPASALPARAGCFDVTALVGAAGTDEVEFRARESEMVRELVEEVFRCGVGELLDEDRVPLGEVCGALLPGEVRSGRGGGRGGGGPAPGQSWKKQN